MTSRIFGSTPPALDRVSGSNPTNTPNGVVADRRLEGHSNAPAPSPGQASRGDSNTAREAQNLQQQTSPTPLMK
jgi:hypothetical protein